MSVLAVSWLTGGGFHNNKTEKTKPLLDKESGTRE